MSQRSISSRLSRLTVPQWVCAALCTLITIDCFHTYVALLQREPLESLSLEQSSVVRAGKVPPVKISQIRAAHLFGELAQGPSGEDPSQIPLSTTLQLSGTIATDDPQRGMAIISDGGAFQVYAVGQLVAGVLLKSVFRDRVIVARGGHLETIVLPRPLLADDRTFAHTDSRDVGQTMRLNSSTHHRAFETPAAPLVDSIVDSSEETDGSGRFLGIRVVPGDDSASFTHSGLIGGDVIVAINGAKVDAVDRGEALWKQVATGTTLTVLRRGKAQDVTVNFAP